MSDELVRRDPVTGEALAPGANGRYEPFAPGHRKSVKSGFWMSPMLREDDRHEVEEIVEALVEMMPFYRDAFDLALTQLACKLWRQRRAYRDLAENGLLREGLPAPILIDLSKLERSIGRDLAEFGLTPRSAAALGADLSRAAALTTPDRLAAHIADRYGDGAL